MTLHLVIILLYFAAILAIGVFSRKPADSVSGFFVAGRRSSPLLITGTLVATSVGGSATVGLAGLGFSRGLTGAWWLLVGSIGLLVLGFLLAEKVRGSGLFTLPQLVAKQYNPRVATVASVIVVVAWTGVIAGQIVASGKILSALQMGTPAQWMVLFTVVFVAYTVIGGQYADIRTDFAQALLISVGVFGGLFFALGSLGGVPGLVNSLDPGRFEFPLSSQFGLSELLGYLLLIGMTYVVGPDIYSKLFSARDVRTARVSALLTAAIVIPFAFAITLLGMCAAALFPQIAPEQAFPSLVGHSLPPLVGALILAALISATMSSADGCLLSASSILTIDILGRLRPRLAERERVLAARIIAVGLGVASLLLALALQGVISALLFAYTVYTCGVAIPVLAGFWKDKLGLTDSGAMAAIIGGGASALAGQLFAVKYLDLGAFLISVVLLFAVSWIDRQIVARPIREVRAFEVEEKEEDR